MIRRIASLMIVASQCAVVSAHAGCAPSAGPVVKIQEALARNGETRITAHLQEITTVCADGTTQTDVDSWIRFESNSIVCGSPAVVAFTDEGARAFSDRPSCGGDIVWVRTSDPLGVSTSGGPWYSQGIWPKLQYNATVTNGTYRFVVAPFTFTDPAARITNGVIAPHTCLVQVCV